MSAAEGPEPGPHIRLHGGGTALLDTTLAAGLALALGALALGLHAWDWRLPYRYDHDALLMLAMLKTFLATGDYHAIARLGAPATGGLNLREFPCYVDLDFALYRPLSLFFPDPARLMNGVLALGYPAIAVSAWAVLRWAGVSRPAAIAAAVLFALLPGHQQRNANHLLYSAYFPIPPAFAVALGLALGRTRPPGGVGLSGRPAVLAAFAIAAMLGFANIYFGAFAGLLWAFAAAYGALAAPVAAARRRIAGLAAGLLTVLCIATGVQMMPSLLYTTAAGPNPFVARRFPFESHTQGLLPEHLILPAPMHRFPPAATLRARSDANLAEPSLGAAGESRYSALGLAGSLGLLALGAALLAPGDRFGLPGGRSPWRATPAFRALAACQLWLLAFAVRGGLGSMFSLLVSPQIRAWSRLSYFLGFGALLAGAWLFDRAARGLARRHAALPWVASAGVLAVGYLDQTTPAELPRAAEVRRRFETDRAFVIAVEAALPPGAAVFQLPHVSFPEHLPPGTIGEYEPIVGYLHSSGLKWSYAAMRMRSTDKWQKSASDTLPAEMVARLKQAGFAALWIDRRGYPDGAAALTTALTPLLPPQTPLSDAPGERLLFKL